jgi:hypothetical protein
MWWSSLCATHLTAAITASRSVRKLDRYRCEEQRGGFRAFICPHQTLARVSEQSDYGMILQEIRHMAHSVQMQHAR